AVVAVAEVLERGDAVVVGLVETMVGDRQVERRERPHDAIVVGKVEDAAQVEQHGLHGAHGVETVTGTSGCPGYRDRGMDFRRINALPPYVFGAIEALKMEARRAGADVVDLGFGNPDIPSPSVAVDKLGEAVRNPRNHRYSSSRGIPKLRLAIADLY